MMGWYWVLFSFVCVFVFCLFVLSACVAGTDCVFRIFVLYNLFLRSLLYFEYGLNSTNLMLLLDQNLALPTEYLTVKLNLQTIVLYRVDRGDTGGGVATYVSCNLVSELIIPDVEPLHFECIKVTLHNYWKHL